MYYQSLVLLPEAGGGKGGGPVEPGLYLGASIHAYRVCQKSKLEENLSELHIIVRTTGLHIK